MGVHFLLENGRPLALAVGSTSNSNDIDHVNDETSVDIPTSYHTMDMETVGDVEMGVRCLKALGVFPKEWEDWSN